MAVIHLFGQRNFTHDLLQPPSVIADDFYIESDDPVKRLRSTKFMLVLYFFSSLNADLALGCAFNPDLQATLYTKPSVTFTTRKKWRSISSVLAFRAKSQQLIALW